MIFVEVFVVDYEMIVGGQGESKARPGRLLLGTDANRHSPIRQFTQPTRTRSLSRQPTPRQPRAYFSFNLKVKYDFHDLAMFNFISIK